MALHVYRLSDDLVPVVIISCGPLPPPRTVNTEIVRELIGVYEDIADARNAAQEARRRADARRADRQ